MLLSVSLQPTAVNVVLNNVQFLSVPFAGLGFVRVGTASTFLASSTVQGQSSACVPWSPWGGGGGGRGESHFTNMLPSFDVNVTEHKTTLFFKISIR